jgi:hygromycin-B 4-O-kinase
MLNSGRPDRNAVLDVLGHRFSSPTELEPLKNGAWSSAFSFRSGSDELVVRFGAHREDFEKEVIASTWRIGLPIPEIVEIGDAFDASYIVSRRHHGQHLSDIDTARVPAVMANLLEVLATIRTIDLPGAGYGIWLAPRCDAPFASWKSYLLSVRERDETRLLNWRAKLAAYPDAEATFHRGCDALESLLRDVANPRQVIHADLLLNHLIAPDNSISAVFDWGNAMAGDPLYDIAWITSCIPWFPAIDRDHVLSVARSVFGSAFDEELLKVYEFHVQLAETPYLAFADEGAQLLTTADSLAAKLAELGG